jgi:phage gp46-like protein
MSPSKLPPPPAQVAAAQLDGAVVKTSGVGRVDGRETMRIVGGDLDSSDVVRDLIIFSLFTWARARRDDPVPPGTSRQGWFAGPSFGSRLWLLQRVALTPQALADARSYAAEALAPLVSRGILARADVVASAEDGVLILDITYARPNAPAQTVRFDRLWES